jgi:hypothetical protein
MTHLPKWVGGKLETFGYPSCRKNNFRGWSMCAREFFKAGECPPHSAGEFEGCCPTAIAAHGIGSANGGRIAADISSRLGSGNLQSAARPFSAVLRTMVTVLSLSLPVVARAQGVALGKLFGASDAPPYFWLPLLGCIGIIISMLYDAHSQRVLRKGLGRCAVVVLAAFIVAVGAFLNGLPFELVLLSIAPWTCFLVLLWGFVTSALGDWD